MTLPIPTSHTVNSSRLAQEYRLIPSLRSFSKRLPIEAIQVGQTASDALLNEVNALGKISNEQFVTIERPRLSPIRTDSITA
jgi:hypothetical protein